MNRINRRILISIHDLLATAVALIASVLVRADASLPAHATRWLGVMLPGILVLAAVVYKWLGLSRPKWRFFSLPDLHEIVLAATVMAGFVLVADYILLAQYLYGTFLFGKVTIALYWLFQIVFLAGSRITYRYFRYTRTQNRARKSDVGRALLVGVSAEVEIILRGVESGAIANLAPVGILSPSAADLQQTVRGVPVLGAPSNFEEVVRRLERGGEQIVQVVLTPSALQNSLRPESIVMRARQLAITLRTLRTLPESADHVSLSPINVEDLLLRPSANIDYSRLECFVQGKSVVVTGGGGSIGSEICDRVVTFGADKLLVIENSEPALHAVLERLAAKKLSAKLEGRIADVRDRDRIVALLEKFRPDLVFHAAALKHVPILENDWAEGVKTNVFGSAVIADASVAVGAKAMVMISTDKAIEPVSVLGATKRLAEIYCQALDDDLARAAAAPNSSRTRIVAVRFGNVLASNGSVVPKFKAQIEAGGPVTVTHPDMVRYFMTIREACDLVVTAASHALEQRRTSDVAVYVLNMGQPVKIVDLAERMIRLSGLEPGEDIEISFTGIRPGERLNEESIDQVILIGLAASLPWSTSATSVLVGLWVASSVLRLCRRPFFNTSLSAAAALPFALVILAAASVLWSVVPLHQALEGVRSYLKLLAITLLFFQSRNINQIYQPLVAYLVSCGALLALSFLMAAWPSLIRGQSYGVPVKDYIAQSGEFVLCAFASIYIGIEKARQREIWAAALWLGGATAFIADVVYISNSRTSLVTLPILSIALGYSYFRLRGTLVAILIGLILAGVAWFTSPYLRDRLGNLEFQVSSYETSGGFTSAGERIEFAKTSLAAIEDAPLIGHGAGSIREMFARFSARRTGQWATPSSNPHDQVFAIGIELGLLGIALLVGMWASHIVLFVGAGLPAWIGLSLVLQNVISSLFNSHLFDFTQGWTYALGVGLLAGAMRRQVAEPQSLDVGQTGASRHPSGPV